MSCGLSVLALHESRLLVYGEINWKMHIRIFDQKNGSFIKDIKSHCDHCYCCTSNICRHPVENHCILETCARCRQIRSYNINTGEVHPVFTKKSIDVLCQGPSNTVIGIEKNGYMYQLEWQHEKRELIIIKILQANVRDLARICYVDGLDSVILVSQDPCFIQAIKFGDGLPFWSFSRSIGGKEVDPYGLCYDSKGRLYIGDLCNKRFLVLDAQRGELLQVVELDEDTCNIIDMDMCYTSSHPQLTLLQGGCNVSLCNVQELWYVYTISRVQIF